MMKTKLAEVFHPAEFIVEEMEARGWDCARLVVAMMIDEFKLNLCAVEMYLAAAEDEKLKKQVRLGELAGLIAKAFGTSEDYWKNLEQSYLENQEVPNDAA